MGVKGKETQAPDQSMDTNITTGLIPKHSAFHTTKPHARRTVHWVSLVRVLIKYGRP